MFKRLQANYQTQEESKEETKRLRLGLVLPCFVSVPIFPGTLWLCRKDSAQSPEPGPSPELTAAEHHHPITWALGTAGLALGAAPGTMILCLPISGARKAGDLKCQEYLAGYFIGNVLQLPLLSLLRSLVKELSEHIAEPWDKEESPWMAFLLMQATEKETTYDKC